MRISDWSSDVCSSDLGDIWITGLDLRAVAVYQTAQAPVDFAAAPVFDDDALELDARRRPRLPYLAVIGEDRHPLDIVGGAPRHHRMDTAAVVADHAAERVAAVGRRIGAEGQMVLLRRVAQRDRKSTRLNSSH